MFGNREPLTPERAAGGGRPAGGGWKRRLIHRLGGTETITPLIFVLGGFEALMVLFALPAGMRGSKEFETVIVIATTVLLAGLIQVLTVAVRWWSVSGERKEFHQFFGHDSMLGVVPDLFSPQITPHWNPPGSNGAHPKGTKIVPFQDLRAAIWIAELFEDFNTTFTITPDTPFTNGTPPERGFVAIGLGFNRLTCMLAAMSRLFEIRYAADAETGHAKDDFEMGGTKHGEPSHACDYALIARVPVVMNGKVTPSFVCAGRTADGTAAAGYFLKNSWRLLSSLYAAKRMRYDDDALAVELLYTPDVIIQSAIGRHVFGPVNWVPAADTRTPEPAETVPVIRNEVHEPATTAQAAVTIPSSNGSS